MILLTFEKCRITVEGSEEVITRRLPKIKRIIIGSILMIALAKKSMKATLKLVLRILSLLLLLLISFLYFNTRFYDVWLFNKLCVILSNPRFRQTLCSKTVTVHISPYPFVQTINCYITHPICDLTFVHFFFLPFFFLSFSCFFSFLY